MSREISEKVNTSVDIPSQNVKKYCDRIIDRLIMLANQLDQIKNPSPEIKKSIDATLEKINNINEKLVPYSKQASDYLKASNKDDLVDDVRSLVENARTDILKSEQGVKEIEAAVTNIQADLKWEIISEKSETSARESNAEEPKDLSDDTEMKTVKTLQSSEEAEDEAFYGRRFTR